MFEIIKDLSESRVFRSESNLRNFSERDQKYLLYLYILAMTILIKESTTKSWTREYIMRTVLYNNFDYFRNVSTDMYQLCYGRDDDKYFDKKTFIGFMQNIRFGNLGMIYPKLNYYQRVLSVSDLRIRDISRIAAYWEDMSDRDKQFAMRILIREIYIKTQISELLPVLRKLEKCLKK